MAPKTSYYNIIFLFAILLVIAYLYQRYKNKWNREKDEFNYNAIQKYLLTEDDIKEGKVKKPILWVYIPYEYNSRQWQSFGSRSSHDLNQPYLYLTAKSIIHHCDPSFHICFIDEHSFFKLLPSWNVDISLLSGSVKKTMMELGFIKLLHLYGGLRVPLSFVCMRNLIDLYELGTSGNKAFLCEMVNRNVTSSHFDFYPNVHFMGAKKGNNVLEEMIEFMQRMISRDHTKETIFLGETDRWCQKRIEQGKMRMIDGKMIGTKTMEDTPIGLEMLISNDYLDLYPQTYGIYIPACELLQRTKFNWFARMSAQQVLESRMIVSKYLLLSNAPDAKQGVIEPLQDKKDWISFWKVPSGAPVWGNKPNFLGDNIMQMQHPIQ
jgi:hypothetical protein